MRQLRKRIDVLFFAKKKISYLLFHPALSPFAHFFMKNGVGESAG